jgi:hypothetical protein
MLVIGASIKAVEGREGRHTKGGMHVLNGTHLQETDRGERGGRDSL